MASDDLDRVEVDRLVIELAHPLKPPAPKVKSAFAALAAEATAPAPRPVTPASVSAPGRSWTTAHVLMPANRPVRRKRFTLPAAGFTALRKAALKKLRETQWGAVSVRTYVGLGVLLCAAMPYWPYAHAWSWGLLLYLCAVELVVVTGIWGAKLTWDAHLPAAHTVAVGTVIWGLGLLVAEAAPRMVYA